MNEYENYTPENQQSEPVQEPQTPPSYTPPVTPPVYEAPKPKKQKRRPSALAVIALALVFGVLGGAVLLHEMLTGREIAGCVIMFVAIIFAQLSEPLTEKLKARKQP